MRELQFLCLRVFAVVPEQNPQKPTRKKAYSANILFYGSVWGFCICASPRRPTKVVLRDLQTSFTGRRDAGSARVALRASSAVRPPRAPKKSGLGMNWP